MRLADSSVKEKHDVGSEIICLHCISPLNQGRRSVKVTAGGRGSRAQSKQLCSQRGTPVTCCMVAMKLADVFNFERPRQKITTCFELLQRWKASDT
jgi:hypothetical protein